MAVEALKQVRRRGGPFLKESVKRNRFFSGLVCTDRARRTAPVFLVRWAGCLLRSCCGLVGGLRLGCRRHGKLQSFFADAIAPHTFLRKVPRASIASSSARKRLRADADVASANSSP